MTFSEILLICAQAVSKSGKGCERNVLDAILDVFVEVGQIDITSRQQINLEIADHNGNITDALANMLYECDQ